MQDTEIQEIFARLTAQFEDCAALAAGGQRAELSRKAIKGLFCEIRDIAKATERCLAEVEQYLDD